MDWNSDSKKFYCNTNKFELVAQVDNLKNGVSVERDGHQFLQLFSLVDSQFSENSEATYKRGSDLFTIFQKANHTAECYWRLCHDQNMVILESIVSLRSSHLETEPCLFGLQSNVDGEGMLEIKDSSTAALQLDSFSLLFLVHPDDANEVKFEETEKALTTSMAVPLLERGVMRRTRSRVCFFDSPPSEAEILRARESFASSEIPLTT